MPTGSTLNTIATFGFVVLLSGWDEVDTENRAIANPPERFSEYVDGRGMISLPEKYQTTFVYLGSYAVASKPGQSVNEMHNVFTRAEDVAAFQRDGRFADGAILVKEVYGTKSAPLTTGDANWSGDIKLWFVMVKDRKGRFPESDHWGDGWGWALFNASAPKVNAVTDFTTDCRACHVPARKDDWIYLRGYPLLKNKPVTK